MSVGQSTFQTLFQTYYPSTDLPYMVPDSLPLLNMIEKVGGLSGDVIDMPFLYGAAQGVSQSFDAAAGQSALAPNSVRPTVRCSQMFKLIELIDKDEALSQGDAAYADLFQKTLDGCFMNFNNEMDLLLHGAGNGVRAQVASVSGDVVTLSSTSSQAPNLPLETSFYVDMQIQASTTAPTDGSVPGLSGALATVKSVDGDARTITLQTGGGANFDAVTNKFIVVRGNGLGFSASNTGGSFIGLDAFNPYVAPSAGENFLGIDRTRYTNFLAGYRYDGSGRSIEDAIKRCGAKMGMGGVKSAKVALLHPLDWDALDSKMASNVMRSQVSTPVYGFDAIRLNTASGSVDCVVDPHQSQGFARLLDPTALKIRHTKDLPHVVDPQGTQAPNFDGRTYRMRAYMQLWCSDTRKMGNVKLPSISI
jgi:hypothetical protein